MAIHIDSEKWTEYPNIPEILPMDHLPIYNPEQYYFDFFASTMNGYIPADNFEYSKYKIPGGSLQHKLLISEKRKLKLMLNTAFEYFIKNGIEVVESDFLEHKNLIMKIAERHGYDHLENNERLVGRLDISNIKINLLKGLGDLSPSRLFLQMITIPKITTSSKSHFPAIYSFLLRQNNTSRDTLLSFFGYFRTNQKKIISHPIAVLGDIVVGHAILIQSRYDPKIGFLNFFHIQNGNNELLQNALMSKLITDASDAGIESIEVHLCEDVLDQSRKLVSFGFRFKKLLTFLKG